MCEERGRGGREGYTLAQTGRENAHPLSRDHRSSHVNQAFVFRASHLLLSRFLHRSLPSPLSLSLFFPFTPVFASPSRCAGQCGTAPISFLCAFRTRAQAWLCGLSSWDTLRQKIRSLDRASRSSRRGLLPRLYRPSCVRSRDFKSASIQINTRTRSFTQFFFPHPVRLYFEFE